MECCKTHHVVRSVYGIACERGMLKKMVNKRFDCRMLNVYGVLWYSLNVVKHSPCCTELFGIVCERGMLKKKW